MHISRTLAFVGYRAIADALGKAAFFVILILAARRLPQSAFGLVALGTTLGWITSVISDCGIGTHLARETARQPSLRRHLLDEWFTLRITIGALVLAVAGLLLLLPIAPEGRTTLALLVLTYAIGGTLETLGGYFRGLSRADLESSLVLLQRAGQLIGASLVLTWRPDPALLALALLVPPVLALLLGVRFARQLAQRTPNVERRTPNIERPVSSSVTSPPSAWALSCRPSISGSMFCCSSGGRVSKPSRNTTRSSG